MLVVAASGEIVLANPQAHDLFGARPGELVGLCVDDLVPERLRGPHADRRRGYHAAPSIRPMGEANELLAQRRDGTEFPTEISLSPLHWHDQTLVIAAVRDRTLRKAAEQELLDATLELDRREARERQALEINDSIVQSLAVAEYRLERGEQEEARQAVRASMEAARGIVEALLDAAVANGIHPGDLRRESSAELPNGGRHG